jgi:hypothetical protein
MWHVITQSGLATATVDCTSDVWLLGAGLVGLVALAAGAITLVALRHHISQRPTPRAETTPTSAGRREAA